MAERLCRYLSDGRYWIVCWHPWRFRPEINRWVLRITLREDGKLSAEYLKGLAKDGPSPNNFEARGA